jgi:hypothetical protein
VIRDALVTSPLSHGRFLHDKAGSGHVTVAQKAPNWYQHSYKIHKLDEVLPAYGGLEDVYISQNRFYGPRAMCRLTQLSAMYADLDYYTIPDLVGMHPLGVTALAFEDLERSKIPRPSLAIATGRGLALIWRHDPVPRAVLPRWKLCQDQIFEALKGLGADPAARDAARVLRLVGTYNSKSATMVQTVWEDDAKGVWTFDELANEILPYTREELEKLRAERRESSEKQDSGGRSGSSKRRDNVEKQFTITTLALGRLSDLQVLLKLRGQDTLPPGRRDCWMFVAGVAMAYLVEPQYLERELTALGRDHAGWGEAETRSRMASVISRAQDASAGKTFEWNGKGRDPRYRLTNRTIIEMLGITPSEEKRMKILISKATKKQRKTDRQKRKRRDEGAKDRDEYLEEARERKLLAQELHSQGQSYRKIGDQLSLSHTHVRRIISGPPR